MGPLFIDRTDAGGRLAERLKGLAGTPDLLVLAIPRGGVVVGAEVAKRLRAPLDIVIPRKIGLPSNEELAIGAVTEDGTILTEPDLASRLRIPPGYIEAEANRQLVEIRRRLERYRGPRALPEVKGKTIVLVDDGIATGYTVRAALQSLRRRDPARLILAVPVAPPDTLGEMEPLADETICLESPESFSAVGQFYADFAQTTDEQVINLLGGYRDASSGKPNQAGATSAPARR